jgi:hypothetical protein
MAHANPSKVRLAKFASLFKKTGGAPVIQAMIVDRQPTNQDIQKVK